MQKNWDGLLESRFCKKAGCGKMFKVLPKSTNFHCCAGHNENAEPTPHCWDKQAMREGIDLLTLPDGEF